MRHTGDENRSLVIELAMWFVTLTAFIVLLLNFDTIRQSLSKSLIASLDATLPAQPSGKPRAARDSVQSPAVPPEPATSAGATVELRSDRRGHYNTDVEINGRRIEALVDTGATIIFLTYEDAQRVGVFLRDQDFTMRTRTANGIGRAAPVKLDKVEIGPIRVRNVDAAVAEPGRLTTNLLGMNFLSRLQKFEFGSGRLVLHD